MGSSVQKFISIVSCEFCFMFFNFIGSGKFQGQFIFVLNQFVYIEFDKVVFVVYDYGELFLLIENLDIVLFYWFDVKNGELVYLIDWYFDNFQVCWQKSELLIVIYDMWIVFLIYDFVVFLNKSQLVV